MRRSLACYLCMALVGGVAGGCLPATADAAPPESSGPVLVGASGREPVGSDAAVFRGVLLTMGSKEPVAGAKLMLDVESSVSFDRRWATTRADGSFEFSFEAPVKLSTLRIFATDRSAEAELSLRLRLERGFAERREIFVSRGGTVTGRMMDETGVGIAGGVVYGWCMPANELDSGMPPYRADYERPPPHRQAVTGEDGSFRLEHMGTRFVLDGSAPGLMCHELPHGEVLDRCTNDGFGVVMVPVQRIAGRVYGPDGMTVPGAAISMIIDESQTWRRVVGAKVAEDNRKYQRSVRCTAAPNGSFSVEVPSGRKVSIAVNARGYASWSGTWQSGDSKLEIRLSRGVTLRGRVLAPDGAPVAGAYVQCAAAGWFVTETDSAGEFEIAEISPKEVAKRDSSVFPYVGVKKEGFALAVRDLATDVAEWPKELSITLEPERCIAGVVRDSAGAPVAGARLEIQGEREIKVLGVFHPRPTWEWRLQANSTVSDSRGAFRFGMLYPGAFELLARNPADDSVIANRVVDAGTSAVEIVLEPVERVMVIFTGHVFDLETALPVSDFKVNVSRRTKVDGISSGTADEFHSADGRFVTTWVKPGDLELRVKARGYASWREAEKPYEAGRHKRLIKLKPCARVWLRITDEDGESLGCSAKFAEANGTVLFLTDAGHVTECDRWFYNRANPEQRDPRGAPVYGLPKDLLTVHVTEAIERRTWSAPLDLRNLKSDSVEVRRPRE